MRFIALSFVIFLSFTGCASLFSSKPAKTPAEERKDFLDKYEKSFNPAEYDEVEDTLNERLSSKNKNLSSAHDAESKEPEFVSGFRVQILFTPEIDEATNIKNGVTPLVKDAVHVIFEAPYYKVRIGDCQTRLTANQLLKTLVDLGYKNAWIVPDKVYKNPQKPKDDAVPSDNY
jgi:hypothetical protein